MTTAHKTKWDEARTFAKKWALKNSDGAIANLARAFLRADARDPLPFEERQDRTGLRLIKSLESGKWYALDDGGQRVAHGHDTAVDCVAAAMKKPNDLEPEKYA